jgi:hypothetical protein
MMATVPKQLELSNRKGTQIVELCIYLCYQSFNPKRDAIVLQFLRLFQAHAFRVHRPRAAEFLTVTPDVYGPSQ